MKERYNEKSSKVENDFRVNLLKRLEEREKLISENISRCKENIEWYKKDYGDYDKVGLAIHKVEKETDTIKLLQIQRECILDIISAVRSAIKDTSKDKL